ncbi:MAG: hypothetical protein LBQ02_01750 [Candidatus Nomurabacteria bacterium]|nr:hypothetical protein [Candidatus Nomurabacteria bacterium]
MQSTKIAETSEKEKEAGKTKERGRAIRLGINMKKSEKKRLGSLVQATRPTKNLYGN